jgi:two-component system chemotaxis sensor kinase CheA
MDELITEFLTETNESLEALDLDLVNLEQNPNDKDLLSKIFRLMHTIKGTCGFLGLPRLEKVAHHAENVLGRFRDGDLEVTPNYVTLIFESIDRIKYIVGEIATTSAEPAGDDSALIEKLDAVYEGRDEGGTPVERAAEVENLETMFEDVRKNMMSDTAAEIDTPAAAPAPSAPAAAPAQAAAHDDKADHKDGGSGAQTLRVNVDVIENLMTMVSELVLTRNQLLQISRTQGTNEFGGPLNRLNHVVSDLQEGVMKTRMQPIGNAWNKLPRIIRDLARELDKKIELDMRGQDTELDRQVLELIKDPLTHMVRNSADHGIEDPKTRLANGKPETGTILLNAYHQGGHIIIEITDDGKGLPVSKIRQKILEKGLASEAELADMPAQQIYQYIFRAGFSTAEKVTSVSGRGVGMDVVRTNIEKIGGSIELRSTEGKGSSFIIKIPLTLAIISALIVESAGERFAIPQLAVRELVMTSAKSEHQIEMIKGSAFLRLRNRLLPLIFLSEMLKIEDGRPPANMNGQGTSNRYIVVTQVGGYQFGIIVDRVFDTEEIVVKPVSKMLRHVEIFSGNTILGDGSVIMILDPNGIAKASGELGAGNNAEIGDHDQVATSNGREKTSLLLFSAGGGAPKTVPLALVARLENVDLSKIEYSDTKMMIQYRGLLMPLTPFNDSIQIGKTGQKPVLVFNDRDSSMGIIVDEIIDITEEYVEVQIGATHKGLMGSAIINGKATDVVDITYYFTKVSGDKWFKDHSDDPYSKGGIGSNTAKNVRRRVLLVDDSPFFRNMLTPMLSIAGYDVTTLDSPVEALKMCEKGASFDIIISDIEMPDMDGFEFAEKVKTSGNWQNTPMVALSSHATPQDISRGMEVGFNKYVAKFDRDDLLLTLSETLSEQQRRHA